MTNVGIKIKERREALGLSQDELAERMGYKSRSTIAKIEKGVNDVTQTNLLKFAEALKTSTSYLMGWIDEETDKKNSTITDIIVRMRTDEDFLSLVETLNTLNAEQLQSVKSLISAFIK